MAIGFVEPSLGSTSLALLPVPDDDTFNRVNLRYYNRQPSLRCFLPLNAEPRLLLYCQRFEYCAALIFSPQSAAHFAFNRVDGKRVAMTAAQGVRLELEAAKCKAPNGAQHEPKH